MTAYLSIRVLIPLYIPHPSTWLLMVSEPSNFITTARTSNLSLKRVAARATG